MLRQAVDSFTLSSFPGGLRAKGARMEDNSVTVGPCEFKEIDTGGLPIQQAVMALPYRDIPPSFAPLFQAITEGGQQLGSIAEMNVGEGNQNAPVGSTLALIEQAVRVESMVIRRLHISLRKEVRMLAEVFAEEPERKYPFTVNGQQGVAIGEDFTDTTDIVPVSDPNAPTQLQRLTMAQTKFQLAQQSGGILDVRVAIEGVLRTMGCDDQETARLMPPQRLANAPGMADRTVRADILIPLKNGVVRAGQQEEISPPALAHMHERDVFRGPGIELIKFVRRGHGPFLDVTDHVLRGHRRFQSQRGQPFSDCQNLAERQRSRCFPAPLTHSSESLPSPRA